MQRKVKPTKTTKRTRHTQRTCDGKVRYRDQQEARAALQRIGKNSDRTVLPSRMYECWACSGWHLTSRPDRYGNIA